MPNSRHGFSIGMERSGNHPFLTLKAVGRLTHNDYEVIAPIIESALSEVKHPGVNVLIDASELQGWETRAAWDDFKIGLKHGNQFARIAIFGNKLWQAVATKIGSWFVDGDVKYFSNRNEALQWLKE